jgi:hypothetical protein
MGRFGWSRQCVLYSLLYKHLMTLVHEGILIIALKLVIYR